MLPRPGAALRCGLHVADLSSERPASRDGPLTLKPAFNTGHGHEKPTKARSEKRGHRISSPPPPHYDLHHFKCPVIPAESLIRDESG